MRAVLAQYWVVLDPALERSARESEAKTGGAVFVFWAQALMLLVV